MTRQPIKPPVPPAPAAPAADPGLPPESPYSDRALETELAIQQQIDDGEFDWAIWPDGKPPQA